MGGLRVTWSYLLDGLPAGLQSDGYMCHLFPNNLKVGILSSVRMVPLKMAGEWLVVPLLVGGRTQLQPAWEEQREPSEHDSGADNGGLQGLGSNQRQAGRCEQAAK